MVWHLEQNGYERSVKCTRSDVVEVSLQMKVKGKNPASDLKRMYETLLQSLPNSSFFNGYNFKPPEASWLDALVGNGGSTVLDDSFAWLVENTKQTRWFHVIMARSVSFFLEWIGQFVDTVQLLPILLLTTCHTRKPRGIEKLVRPLNRSPSLWTLMTFINVGVACLPNAHILAASTGPPNTSFLRKTSQEVRNHHCRTALFLAQYTTLKNGCK